MRGLIAMLWLALASFILTPIGINYITGDSYEQILPTIEVEAETEISQVIGEMAEGNRVLLAFTTADDFGVAVFSHYGDSYRYEEGTMSNGMGHIDVNLDTGWDIYVYEVTADGIYTLDIREGEGLYRTYGIAGCILAGITVLVAMIRRRTRRKAGKRKKGKDVSE